MRISITSFLRTNIVGTFAAGMAAIVPLAVTILVVGWLVGKIGQWFGPETLVGGVLTRWGDTVIGSGRPNLSFWIGLALAFVAVWALGLLVRRQAKRRIERLIGDVLERLPLIKYIYKPVTQVMQLLSRREKGTFAGMRVCACRFGGEAGAVVLALLASHETFDLTDRRMRLVYMPTSPVPMSGGLVFVPEASVEIVPDMTVNDLVQLYLSLGILAAEALPPRLRT